MNEININEIVKIEQMPKVFSQLEKIGELIEEKTKDLNDLECTEQNKQIIKNRRTEINKTLEILEERRIEIKNKLLEPYDIFEEKYNKECKIKLQKASNLLKTKIEGIEEEQKLEKENELREFFEEHCKDKNVNVQFERMGLNITLSASMKSLKEQTLAFIEKIASDLKLIELEEYKEEILLEYNSTLDFAKSKMIVIERHKQIEELQRQKEELAKKEDEEQKVVEIVEQVIEEEITAPQEIIEEEELLTITFTITDTKENVIKVREFMKKEGIRYE